MGIFQEIRGSAAAVAQRARSVRIREERLAEIAPELASALGEEETEDPAHHRMGDDASTLAYVLTLDAVNFGSGWFPVLAKLPGCSGYFTIAKGLRAVFEERGPWSARELLGLDAADCARVFGQDPSNAEAMELMERFAAALRDLGALLEREFAGSFEGLVEDAGGSAARLVASLERMPAYRDVASYQGLRVPFFKRAQITAADLGLAFEGRGPGAFDDLDELTIFADNLVPHVLRCEGVLEYAPDLAERIEREDLLRVGSPEEVEIRALAVHAVELIRDHIAREGIAIPARRLDQLLWTRGQLPSMKARPRHRARSVYY